MPIITTTKELRPREPNDFYPTPKELIKIALNLITIEPEIILDPGAGTGIWGKIAKQKWPETKLIGVEIQEELNCPEYNCWLTQDYLQSDLLGNECDLIIGNPPYKLAEEFIRQSLKNLKERGQLLFLLRLAFLESQRRGQGLWREHKPKKVYVCSKRPSFTGNSKTDATAYAIFLWEKGWEGKTELGWLVGW